jgi:cyclophilin family peptidyl-prolyl cis-trans isomerase
MKESGKFLLRMGLSLTLAVGMVGMLVAQDKKAEAPKKDPAPSDSKSKEEKGKDKPMALGSKGELAVIETNLGTMKIKFFSDAAPKAVENFLGLAQKGYYNGLIFHRVIDRFMIQGGDPTGTGAGGESLWGKDFEDEFSPKYRFNKKGLLAMANRGPRTNGSQFFITLVPTPHLNDKHTIFGEVVEGLDVVDKIGKVKTGAQDRPIDPVKMVKVIVELPKAKPEDEKKK